MKLSKLKLNDKNPRTISDVKFEKLKTSIKDFEKMMALRPIVCDENFVVIGGNMRTRALEALGYKDIPDEWVKVAEGLTEDEKRRFIIEDNVPFGEWDWDMLFNEWDTEQLQDWGLDLPVVDVEIQEEQKAEEDDFDEDKDEIETKSKRGDIYKLGNHRLMCGDSASSDVAILMNGAKADFVFTDPPYGVAIGDKNKLLADRGGKGGKITKNITGDTLKKDDLYEMLKSAMTNCRLNCKDDASYYVTAPQGGELGMMMMMMMQDAGLLVRHNLVWVKNSATFSLGRLDYDYRHEPVFYTWTKSHKFYREEYQNTVIEDDVDVNKLTKVDVNKLTKDELKKMVKDFLNSQYTSVVREDKPLKCELHPTMKPISLIARFMKNNSRENDIVLDVFGGSGSTLITAEQLHRKCYIMELDAHYCDVIIARWEKFTGRKAELIEHIDG